MANLELSEHFHRLKRTALLFSVALIISFIQGVERSDSGLTGLSFKAVDADFIKLLLWGAAAYYTWGFYLEFETQRRRNSAFVESGAVTAVEASLKSIATRLREVWPEQIAPDEQDEYLIAKLRQGIAMFRADAPREAEALASLPDRLRQAYQRIAARRPPPDLERFRAVIDEVLPAMRLEKKELSKLHASVTAPARWQFYLWDLGGVLGTFAFGTLLGVLRLVEVICAA